MSVVSARPAIIEPVVQQVPMPPPAPAVDAQAIRLWLARSGSPHRARSYERRVCQVRAHVGKPLGAVRLDDLRDDIAARSGASTKALAAASLNASSPSRRRSGSCGSTSAWP